MSRVLHVALWGNNGHQIHGKLANHPRARLVAFAGFDRSSLPEALREQPAIVEHDSLDALLRDPAIELVSLCAPRRRDQAKQAVAAMEAGKHVYAEKPCAMSEADLDAILATARRTGRVFHEMADTAFTRPYFAMRQIVRSGKIGAVVQIACQKSYPWHDRRPQDPDVDGGLIGQVGVHALRWVEHVAGRRILAIRGFDTLTGNPVKGGGCKIAASLALECEGGAVATVGLNYLNPRKATKTWGYEELRIFGTRGIVESTDGGRRTRLFVDDQDLGPIDASVTSPDYFDLLVNHLLDGSPMPLTPEEELSPSRWTLRATAAAGH